MYSVVPDGYDEFPSLAKVAESANPHDPGHLLPSCVILTRLVIFVCCVSTISIPYYLMNEKNQSAIKSAK